MIAHALLIPLLMGLLNQTQILSHVTKRVVEDFGRDPGQAGHRTVVVPIDQVPAYPYAPPRGIDPADWLVIPPPSGFVLLSDNPDETCVMGVVLDGVDGGSPHISWMRIDWNTPVSVSLPVNALGAFFGIVNGASGSLTLRRVDEFVPYDGYEVLALRDAWENPYRGTVPAVGEYPAARPGLGSRPGGGTR